MFKPRIRTWFPVRLTEEERKHERTYEELHRLRDKLRLGMQALQAMNVPAATSLNQKYGSDEH